MGRLRIIAGDLRGRRILVPEGTEVRPTGDRVREALFDILAGRVAGARVLDAYAGSGALGLEALSRGAQEVVFCEAAGPARSAILRNLRDLGLVQRGSLVHGRMLEWLERAIRAGGRERFDLVLADPPYGSAELPRFLERVAGVMRPEGWVVVERDREDPTAMGSSVLRHLRTARYGRACLDFYGVDPMPDEEGPAVGGTEPI